MKFSRVRIFTLLLWLLATLPSAAQFAEWPPLAGFTIVQDHTENVSGVVLRSRPLDKLVYLDLQGELSPLPLPPSGHPYRVWSTRNWMACKNDDGLQVLDLTERKAWRPPILARNRRPSFRWPMPDHEGNLFLLQRKADHITYATKTQQWEQLRLPVLETSSHPRAQSLLLGDDLWIAHRRYRQLAANADPGGLVRVRAGIPTLLKTHDQAKEQVVSIALFGEQILIQYWSGKRAFVDSDAKPVAAPFDPSPLGDQLVVLNDVAPDGTVWLLTTARYGSAAATTAYAEGAFLELWRVADDRLQRVVNGLERIKAVASFQSHLRLPTLRAVSHEEVWVGTSSAGLLWHKEGVTRRFDWRVNLPSTTVVEVLPTPERLFFSDGYDLLQASYEDLEALDAPTEMAPSQLTLGDVMPAPDGTHHAIRHDENGLILTGWNGKTWDKEQDVPIPEERLWSVGYDSLSRPWVYESATGPVYVWQPKQTEWQTYATRQLACEKEVEQHGVELAPGLGPRHFYYRTLVAPDGTIVFKDADKDLHVFQGGTWVEHPAPPKGFYSRPLGLYQGAPVAQRIREPVILKDGRWQPVNLPPKDHARLIPERTVPLWRRKDYKDHGGLTMMPIEDGDMRWFFNRERNLVCVRADTATRYSLKGTPLFAYSDLQRIVLDGKGGMFLGTRNFHLGKYEGQIWHHFDPELPRIEFKMRATLEGQTLTVETFDHNVAEPLETLVRLNDGDWVPGTTIEALSAGPLNVEVRCAPKNVKPYFSITRAAELKVAEK